ncbi:MAG: cupredoxin domain-containing protein [Chloroflexi bacterium]|nr:cupredoxin domain-containing protein [Chloroflexota bacterium]
MTGQPTHDHPETVQTRAARRAAARAGQTEASGRRIPRRLRLALFGVITVVVAVGAIGLVVSRLQGPAATDTTAIQVHASMGGFDPKALTVKTGQKVKIEVASMDDSMHSDGGGWHQFAIDALGINIKVGPLSTKVFEFTAPVKPGTYSWYCDICCGGKANPTMQGKLTVAA